MLLGDDDEVAAHRLAAVERRDLDVEQRDEGDVGPVDRVGETALVALRRQRDVADDDVRSVSNCDPFDRAAALRLRLMLRLSAWSMEYRDS